VSTTPFAPRSRGQSGPESRHSGGSSARSRVLLVGMAPSRRTSDDPRPFSGLSGKRLAALAGVERLEDHFDLANLLDRWPGRDESGHDAWDEREAIRAAWEMHERIKGRDVVLVGRAVARAFTERGAELPYFHWLPMSLRGGDDHGGRFAIMPHPSGRVRFWNDPENVRAAERFLRSLR
jgi:uracil-DNA glycosylase